MLQGYLNKDVEACRIRQEHGRACRAAVLTRRIRGEAFSQYPPDFVISLCG